MLAQKKVYRIEQQTTRSATPKHNMIDPIMVNKFTTAEIGHWFTNEFEQYRNNMIRTFLNHSRLVQRTTTTSKCLEQEKQDVKTTICLLLRR